MKKYYHILSLLLLLTLLSALLCGCGKKQDPESVAPTEEPTEETAPPEPTPEEIEEEDPELSDPNRTWEPIETKFGRLRYPDEFFDYLETEQSETEDTVTVLFRAKIGEKTIDLFEMSIGKGEGEAVGKVTGPDGQQRNLYLRFIELEGLDELTEGETNRVYAMQEALNFVMDTAK